MRDIAAATTPRSRRMRCTKGKDYTIYFPQIEFSEAARERGVYDQVLRITQRADVAKQVFEEAVRLVESGERDVYSLYKKIEKFSEGLPYEHESGVVKAETSTTSED